MTVTAYCKLLLHLVKYPHCAVNGVFLAEKQKGKDQRTLKCVDVVPLFHLSIGLAPMLEIALTQVSDLVIVWTMSRTMTTVVLICGREGAS